MNKKENEQIEKICGKDYDHLDIPTYIRNRDEKEEILDEHIYAEILMDQVE